MQLFFQRGKNTSALCSGGMDANCFLEISQRWPQSKALLLTPRSSINKAILVKRTTCFHPLLSDFYTFGPDFCANSSTLYGGEIVLAKLLAGGILTSSESILHQHARDYGWGYAFPQGVGFRLAGLLPPAPCS